MKSMLTALKEGRLVELPAADKGKSLEYLANMIEAVPDLPSVPELYEAMMARERSMNTGIGMGVACPHVRASSGSELVCAIGWSPTGIDYGSPDGKKVHLVVMYYIPESQMNVYLKELSALATAVKREGGIQPIANAEDIATVRERLLDWVSSAIEANTEAKARMIRLEARQAATEAAPPFGAEAGPIQVAKLLFLERDGEKPVVLCQAPGLAAALEKDEGLPVVLKQRLQFDRGGYRLVYQTSTQFEQGRTLSEYLAVRVEVPAAAAAPAKRS